MAVNTTVSILITYTVICAAFLRFFKWSVTHSNHPGTSYRQCLLIVCSTRRATQGLDPPTLDAGQDRAAYNRENKSTYPYKSHWQYLRAWYGMIACGAMAFFNGWRTIDPIAGEDFVASYISVRYESLTAFAIVLILLCRYSYFCCSQ